MNKWEKVGTKATKIQAAMKPAATKEEANEKTVSIRIKDSSHHIAKTAAVANRQTLQSFIEDAIAEKAAKQ